MSDDIWKCGIMSFPPSPFMILPIFNSITLTKCGITINTDTGEVSIPETLSLSEASREFWVALSENFKTGYKNAGSN